MAKYKNEPFEAVLQDNTGSIILTGKTKSEGDK